MVCISREYQKKRSFAKLIGTLKGSRSMRKKRNISKLQTLINKKHSVVVLQKRNIHFSIHKIFKEHKLYPYKIHLDQSLLQRALDYVTQFAVAQNFLILNLFYEHTNNGVNNIVLLILREFSLVYRN